MASRKQAQLSRVLKEAVSNAILKNLSDPRIEGLVTVTRVEMSADLHSANVFFSIFGGNEASSNKTFSALKHARSRIQSLVARQVHRRFCPSLNFYKDEHFKKTLETMNLIDEAVGKYKDKDDVYEEQ